MTDTRLVIHAAFVLLLPVIVAVLGLSVWSAIALVCLGLLWRWALVMLGWRTAHKGPDLVLETISASHYVEKVRWSLDRLGVEYVERPWAATLGAFYRGRTVPRLHIRTGAVWSRLGNSAEILRYLWGAYAARRPQQSGFLEPTPERLAFEENIDRCGRSVQVWVYTHLTPEPALLRRAWGVENPVTPWWQRKLLALATPLQIMLIRNAFQVSDAHCRKACARIEEMLDGVETRLADGRASILGGSSINYTDIAFAAVVGFVLRPQGYGGGMADGVWIDDDALPSAMRDDIGRWRHDYPRSYEYINTLYRDQRRVRP